MLRIYHNMTTTEFSANVEVKYNTYMKERTEYLERNKVTHWY